MARPPPSAHSFCIGPAGIHIHTYILASGREPRAHTYIHTYVRARQTSELWAGRGNLNFDSELELNRVWFVVLCQCKRHWFNRVPGALDLKRGYVPRISLGPTGCRSARTKRGGGDLAVTGPPRNGAPVPESEFTCMHCMQAPGRQNRQYGALHAEKNVGGDSWRTGLRAGAV